MRYPVTMALYAIPVIIPFQLAQDPDGVVHTLSIEAVASSGQAALAIARLVLETHTRLRYGTTAIPLLDRCAIDKPTAQIRGPYAYVFTTGDRVPHLAFPPRLEGSSGKELDDTLKGLQQPWVEGVVIDCAGLRYIASAGLSALASHAKRLDMQVFRVPEGVGRVLEIVGLHKFLSIHPDLSGALSGLIHTKATARVGTKGSTRKAKTAATTQ